jgi:hypothetical protein
VNVRITPRVYRRKHDQRLRQAAVRPVVSATCSIIDDSTQGHAENLCGTVVTTPLCLGPLCISTVKTMTSRSRSGYHTTLAGASITSIYCLMQPDLLSRERVAE